MAEFQVAREKPNEAQVRRWNYRELLEHVNPLLKDCPATDLEAFGSSGVPGKVFLDEGSDLGFYRTIGLSFGASYRLLREWETIMGNVLKKSMLHFR
jgi:hypothetical protein